MIPLKILNVLKRRSRRFPKIYELDLLIDILMRTCVAINKPFLTTRPHTVLEKLVCVQYHLFKKTELKGENPKRRNIAIKLFKISHNDGTNVLSIAIGVNQRQAHELLEEKHIYKALASLIPGIEVISESFYCCPDKNRSFLFCYVEIKKLRGKNLTYKDIDLLRKKLPLELKQNIQTLTFTLQFSYNEETIYKNAIHLAGELKSENDLPQVIIFFQDHVHEVLRFNVVLVRARKKNENAFQQTGSLSSSARLLLQKVIALGFLPEGVIKEAIIFSLEIDYSLFLRKNWSIDLNQARNYVVKIIEQLFGPFRDYNGGLLSQQNKQLENLKRDLRGKYKNFYPLVEELFQSFSPPSFQALIPTSTAKQIFSLFIAFVKKDESKGIVTIEEKKRGNSVFVFIKTVLQIYLDLFIEEIKSFQKGIYSSVGYSYFEYEGEHYLCFIDLNRTLKLDIKSHIERVLRRKHENREPFKEKKILRLNFQEGDPPSLNPQIAIDQRCRSLGKGLFEGLTRLNLEGVPEPAAAKEIKISPCQTVYTFILRKHNWSNGEEVSAYDFEQTWKSAVTTDSNCLRSDLFYIIKNARLAHQGLKSLDDVKVKAVNAKTLVVELEYPAFYFLYLLSHPIFSPLYKGQQEPYYFNGPFLLKEWKRGSYLNLTSNPYYWDKKNVQLNDIAISMHKDDATIGKLFDQGELDWFGEPFNTSMPEAIPLKKRNIWQKKKVDQFYWIYLNTRKYPLNSSNIRKALACAINRKLLMKTFKGKPHYFNSLFSTAKRVRKWDGNAILAQQFFEQGLRELNITKEEFPELTIYWSFPGEKHIIYLIQEQIENALGVMVKVECIPWKNLSSLLDQREYQISTCYRSSPYFYHRSYLELFRDCSNLYNSSQWENPQYKDLVDKALQSFQDEDREKYLLQAEQILMDEMPVIPVFFPDYCYLVSPKIKQFGIASNGDIDFKWIITNNDHHSELELQTIKD